MREGGEKERRKSMNRKIIFLDIDGTFIGMGQTEPPASAVEAIRRARENGHLVYL